MRLFVISHCGFVISWHATSASTQANVRLSPNVCECFLANEYWVLTMPRLVLFLILSAVLPTAAQSASSSKPTKRVLFIGNSLTAAYNIPALVEAFSNLNQTVKLSTDSVVMPGTNLEDQWNAGHAVKKIREAHWDFVVLQQGPTSRLEDRANLIHFARKFAGEAHHAGAAVAMYMVWPSKNETDHFMNIAGAFRAAAQETHGTFIPAGNAWKVLLDRGAGGSLYSDDDFHPSARGAVLSALVIHNVLCACRLERLPERWSFPDGKEFILDNAQQLIDAADTAIAEARKKEKQ